jgi:DNA-binding CsgD family transcriptional regulator
MAGYITVKEAANKWGLGSRMVAFYCAKGRIPGTVKKGNVWLIPQDSPRPADKRRREARCMDPVFLLETQCVIAIATTTLPMENDHPDRILQSLTDERLRTIADGELAYLRGDFTHTLRCYEKTQGDDAARLRICPVTIAAAISLGNYAVYTQVEAYLNECARRYRNSRVAAIAEQALATAAVSVIAPSLAPDWLKLGDFSVLTPPALPNALYLRAKYFVCLRQWDVALAVAQTSLTLLAQPGGFTMTDLYLKVFCAICCHQFGRKDEAAARLTEIMAFALPHGFITPFAEAVTAMGGLVEKCLEQAFPAFTDTVLRQWKATFRNWTAFHNRFTQDNLTLVLSRREYHIAQMVARRIPYAKVAQQQCISVGRLKNIMLEVYEKLCIRGRDELGQYVF